MSALADIADRLSAAAPTARPRPRPRRTVCCHASSPTSTRSARPRSPSTRRWPGRPHRTSTRPARAARRMTIARGFARHLAGIDERTEVPPLGLIPMPAALAAAVPVHPGRHRHAARLRPTPMRLAAPGGDPRDAARVARRHRDAGRRSAPARTVRHRLGRRRDRDPPVEVRQVPARPVLPDTLAALDHYATTRDRLRPTGHDTTFFVSRPRHRADLPGRPAGVPHAVRHRPDRCRRRRAARGSTTFATPSPSRTLLGWYRAGEDIEARLPSLSTYLGHRDPRSTYWYLSAAPELLALAAGQLEPSRRWSSR